MNIKTIDRDLYILQIITLNSNYEYMICIDNMEEKNNKYDVLKIKDYSMICRIMPLLNSQMKNRKFIDLVDCFSKDNAFYAVFRHNDEKMLSEYLKNSQYNTDERIEILKNLIEKIVMSDIPVPVQADILSSESITVSDSMRIGFRYDLSRIADYSQFDMKKLQKFLRNIVKKVLEREISNEVSEKLSEYCANLGKGNYNEYIELYSAYMEAYNEIKQNINDNSIEKQSKWLRLWERIKSLLRLVKPFTVSLLIIAALAYLAYVLLFDNKDTAGQTYQSIGSLDIKEYESYDN